MLYLHRRIEALRQKAVEDLLVGAMPPEDYAEEELEEVGTLAGASHMAGATTMGREAGGGGSLPASPFRALHFAAPPPPPPMEDLHWEVQESSGSSVHGAEEEREAGESSPQADEHIWDGMDELKDHINALQRQVRLLCNV